MADVPGFHQLLHFPDKVVADSSRGQDGDGTSATHHGTNGRADQWGADHQARQEPHHAQAQDVGHGRERLSVERERSVGVPHDHCHVIE
jgi:hypothetical protein